MFLFINDEVLSYIDKAKKVLEKLDGVLKI